MKQFSVYYTYQGEKDQTANHYYLENTFQNLDDSFPESLESRAMHFRFKTLCEESEPKMTAWIDISNPNAKVPLLNNCVHMKILGLPNQSLSKIYTQQKIQNLRTGQIQNEGKNLQQNAGKKQDQVVKKTVEPLQSQQGKQIQQLQIVKPEQQLGKNQSYTQQQKILDSLLEVSDDFGSPQQSYKEERQEKYEKVEKPANQLIDMDSFDNFVTGEFVQQRVNQQILNLLGEEEEEEVKQPRSREEQIQRDKDFVQQQVDVKVKELKDIWNAEDQYTLWRQEAKEQYETMIMKWAFKEGQRIGVRNMLATLHEILWEGSEWKQCSIGDLLSDGQVKRKYVDAIRIVHPDKSQVRDYRQRFIAERVFFELNQSYNLHRKNIPQPQG